MNARSVTAPELAHALKALSRVDAVESVAGTTGRDGLSMICVTGVGGAHCYIEEVDTLSRGRVYVVGYTTSPHLAEAVRTFISGHVPGAVIM